MTEVHRALTTLPEADQARLGVMHDRNTGPHQLTYRQVELSFHFAVTARAKPRPDGPPSADLARICDDLLEASIPAGHKNADTALGGDWTDAETWPLPPQHGTTGCPISALGVFKSK
jgi:hypothetical protein